MATDQYDFTAGGETYDLTLTVTPGTGNPDNGLGTVTGISGTVDGQAITSLDGSFEGADNQVYSLSTEPFSLAGLSFDTASSSYNVYGTGGPDTAQNVTANNDPSTGGAAGVAVQNATFNVVCYLSGTRIRTPGGEAAVEHLRVGDLVLTASGAQRPVRWLGSRRLSCARHPNPEAVWPIRIQAGALAPAVPARDLWVSPGHSILFGQVLIQAQKLVNGATITQVPLESVEYWHVELDSHDIILAEGLAAESYLDTGNRTAFFNNGAAFLDAHPDFAPKHWAETCVPLVFEGSELQQARSQLLERALALGYTLTDDPDVHAMVDGQRVDPVRLGAQRLAFLLPQGGSSIELRSRCFVPAQINPNSTDARCLGICVYGLQIDSAVALDDDAILSAGWNALERPENRPPHRWSRECMPLPAGTRLVVIDMHQQDAVYWLEVTKLSQRRARRPDARR